MNMASTTASRWTVSTRTRGEVQTASASAPALELVLLGIPSSFTPAEADGWLRDLAGVAGETSREDARARAIPALLHHALTGLLFSQAELWAQPGSRGPCSVAFVDSAEGPAFGWVGEARVQVMADGTAFAPQWVIVRDQDGREARAALLPGARPATLTLEFWPHGEDGSEAPVAIEAEWLVAGAERVTEIPAAVETPAPEAHAEPPAEIAAVVSVAPAPVRPALASLPLQQPGIAAPPHESHASDLANPPTVDEDAQVARIAIGPDNEPLGPHVTAVLEALESGTMLLDEPPGAHGETAAPPRATHPVGRWLGRLLGLGRRTPREPESGAVPAEAPVSAYDSLLSDSVPATAMEAAEQTTLELPPLAPPLLVEPDAPDFARPRTGAQPAPNLEIIHTPGFAPARSDTFAFEPPFAPPAAEFVMAPIVLAPIEETGLREDVARAMRDADAATLPVLPTPPGFVAPAAGQPLQIDHEPVGADVVFAIPLVPVRPPAPPVPAAAHVIAPLPMPPAPPAPVEGTPPAASEAPPAARHESPAPWIEPLSALGARVHVRSDSPVAPPRLGAAWPSQAAEAPPAQRVPNAPVAPAAQVVPVAPVAPAAQVVPVVPVAPAVVDAPVARVVPVASVAPLVAEAPGAPAAPMAPVAPVVVKAPVGNVTVESPALAHAGAVTPGTPPSGSVAPEAGPQAAPEAPASPESAEPPAIARRPWPAYEPPARRRVPGRLWAWAGVVAVVFAAGWLVGVVTNPTERGTPGPFTRLLRAVGLGSPHYVASVNSTPNGAWIAVDGKDVSRRTPADIELPPGSHTIKLSLPELGGTEIQVTGAKDEKVSSNTALNGGLEVYSSDPGVPISVSLDGRDVGYAPVRLESVVPGLHELQFTGPGMPAWAQTVQVGVRRTAQVVAHPMSAPANGVVQVQATLNDERGALPLSGAQVFVDGQLRGVTPASFELPRGPHSLKLTWREETAPVQVIELPGGNQRFASFNFGLDTPSPQLVLLGGVHPATAEEQVIVSATLTTLQLPDVREGWLHVSTPDGLWRRYPMTVMAGARGPVLVSPFPSASLAGGSARWYVSASTQQGDEYFSEMQSASLGGAGDGAARSRRRAAGTTTP